MPKIKIYLPAYKDRPKMQQGVFFNHFFVWSTEKCFHAFAKLMKFLLKGLSICGLGYLIICQYFNFLFVGLSILFQLRVSLHQRKRQVKTKEAVDQLYSLDLTLVFISIFLLTKATVKSNNTFHLYCLFISAKKV